VAKSIVQHQLQSILLLLYTLLLSSKHTVPIANQTFHR